MGSVYLSHAFVVANRLQEFVFSKQALEAICVTVTFVLI
jgi:hypothetical protein